MALRLSRFAFNHRAGLNRGVPMDRSTQIMGGSFRRGLNSEVVTFSTRLAVQPSHLYKSNGEKINMAASYFCTLPSDWPKWIYSSIQSSSMPLLLSIYRAIQTSKNTCNQVHTILLLTNYCDLR